MHSPRMAGRPIGPEHAVRRRRDLGIQRARSVTKTLAVASAAAVAAFGFYISRALPGHTAPSNTSTVSPSDSGTPGSASPSGSQSPSDLTPPSSPPGPSRQQAPVVSGSS